jgi:hypothetical protein
VSKPKNQSKQYKDTVDLMSRAIAAWFDVHPGADPQFKFPPAHVSVTGALPLGSDYWEANADGRALVEYVDKASEHQASMLQFQACYGHYVPGIHLPMQMRSPAFCDDLVYRNRDYVIGDTSRLAAQLRIVHKRGYR